MASLKKYRSIERKFETEVDKCRKLEDKLLRGRVKRHKALIALEAARAEFSRAVALPDVDMKCPTCDGKRDDTRTFLGGEPICKPCFSAEKSHPEKFSRPRQYDENLQEMKGYANPKELIHPGSRDDCWACCVSGRYFRALWEQELDSL